jgi:dipeptidyl aminopeptidase/acylaminoacyl peptidase
VQLLASEGYAVLLPNVRGSTGYGVRFRDMALRDWGGGDLADIVAGRAFLAHLPYVNGDRIAIVGASYGGFLTYLALVKHPDLWRAAVAWMGITDLPALYETDLLYLRDYLQRQMGDPERNAALWRDRSAVNFVERVRTPLFIIHGINDARCPIGQARSFRDRLRASGKQEGTDFEYVELSGEGHGSMDPEQQIRTYELMTDFLGRRLRLP